jgi:acyl-CoA synthetase (NDP forming)
VSGSPRPPRATGALPEDPDLAAVVEVWPTLPELVRAGIVAVVKAAALAGKGIGES